MKNEFSCVSHVWHLSLIDYFMNMLFTWCLYTHILFVFSWLCFHEHFWALSILSDNICVLSYDSWDTYNLFSCFEGSLTSFLKIILTSYLFFNWKSFSNYAKIFSNFYFWKPLPTLKGRMEGRPCLVCSN